MCLHEPATNPLKKKIYFAKRIAPDADSAVYLCINSSMTVQEVMHAYAQKEIDKKNYIHNGHWILRGINLDDSFAKSSMPQDVTPYSVWCMVRQKIETSDLMVAIVNPKAFGTIAEIGYASASGRIAVYVLPDKGLDSEDIQDLWLVFQAALNTKELWNDEDIKNIDEFSQYNIFSLQNYLDFVQKIVPNFLKKV